MTKVNFDFSDVRRASYCIYVYQVLEAEGTYGRWFAYLLRPFYYRDRSQPFVRLHPMYTSELAYDMVLIPSAMISV